MEQLLGTIGDLYRNAGNFLILSAQGPDVEYEPGLIKETGDWISRHSDLILELMVEHLWLVVFTLIIAVTASVTVGIIISYYESTAQTVLSICQILMVIPSMAMLAFMVPLFGIGFTTGVAALVLYSLLPIVRNTYTGIRELDPAIVEAAKGMGMTEKRVLLKIKIPLARPVIMAGIRTAAVMMIGIAAIAAYVGAGGLGELIFSGISRGNQPMIIAGAIGVSIIAVAFDYLLYYGEKRFSVEGRTKEG
ncbi:MAG: ABC transporter permease [Bacillota bacterium]